MRSGIGNDARDPIFIRGVNAAGVDVGGTKAQATIATSTKTLAAGTAQTILTASTAATGARVLNWTASAVYVASGVTGTPLSGAPSDYIPAAASGVPGQWEPPYAPVDGLRAVGATAGDLTVISF